VPLLLPLGLALVLAARRHGRWSWLLWFAAGGLPFAIALCAANYARFGSITDTGYPSAGSWFNYPMVFGATKLLIGAGKGILWFTPLLWLMLPLAARRANAPTLRWLAWTLFLLTMAIFGSTNGWQSGQCWGARYVTPGIVGLLVLTLPQARPWQRWPRAFWALVALGIAVNVTGIVAPTRGHNQLAGQAVRAMYEQRFARGEISQLDLDNLDEADHFFFQPRFSPLHAHWNYAWRSLTGGFEDERGQPRDGAEFTIRPLFGIDSDNPERVQAPQRWEDRGMRHLWFVFWSRLTGAPWWLLLAVPLLLGTLLVRRSWRRVAMDAAT
jgi:hypothetical protein